MNNTLKYMLLGAAGIVLVVFATMGATHWYMQSYGWPGRGMMAWAGQYGDSDDRYYGGRWDDRHHRHGGRGRSGMGRGYKDGSCWRFNGSSGAQGNFTATPEGATYARACGSCHRPFEQSMFPEAQWRGVVDSLPEHYGMQVNLNEACVNSVRAYLKLGETNGASGS